MKPVISLPLRLNACMKPMVFTVYLCREMAMGSVNPSIHRMVILEIFLTIWGALLYRLEIPIVGRVGTGVQSMYGAMGVQGNMWPAANTVKDATENTEMMLFWGCDPETTPWGFTGQFCKSFMLFLDRNRDAASVYMS